MNQNRKPRRSDQLQRNRGSRMGSQKTILVTLGLVLVPLIVFITLMAGPSPLHTQGQDIQANAKKELVEDKIPIVNYDETQTTDQVERSKRRIRGSKYDKSQWNVDPTDTSDTTVRVDFVDPNLPAFPFSQSIVVVVGYVTGARAYLSNDRTGVYTEFTLDVEEVLKSELQASLAVGCTIEIIREGGHVKFPSGRVHLYKTSGEEMPRVGARYVIFLTGTNQEQGLQILTAYELQADKILPLDNLPKPQTYKNVNVTAFLNELRIKAASYSQSPQ